MNVQNKALCGPVWVWKAKMLPSAMPANLTTPPDTEPPTAKHDTPARKIIESYAMRMSIEQRLAEAIRSVSLDALASAVPLHVDLDVALVVLARTTCAALRRRLPGYATTPGTLQRRFLSTSGIITTHRDQITVRINRRTCSPVLRQAWLVNPGALQPAGRPVMLPG
jgi:hypothetical protein